MKTIKSCLMVLLVAVAFGVHADVEPLLSERWHQHNPYDDLAPVLNGQQAPCGCVATAAAQTFHHYRWPVRMNDVTEGAATYKAGNVVTPFPLAVDGHNPFLWDAMNDSAGDNDIVGNFESSKLTLWCDALAKMCFQTGGSNTKFDDLPEGVAYWYEKGEALMPSQGDHRERVKQELAAGCPVLTAIYGHEVVIDGWRASDDMYHANWGQNDSNTKWYNMSASVLGDWAIDQFWVGLVPRKLAQVEPIPTLGGSSVVLRWAFPDVHTNGLDGFTIRKSTYGNTVGNVTLDDPLSVVPDRGDYYRIGAVYGLTANSTFACTVTSYHACDLSAEIQARFDGGEWKTIATPEISQVEDEGGEGGKPFVPGQLCVTNVVALGSHAGKAAEFRVKTKHASNASAVNADVYVSDVKLTNVMLPEKEETLTAGKDVREMEVAGLTDGGFYSFTVTPKTDDAVESEPVGMRVVEAGQAIPALPAVASIDCMSSQVENGFRRTCGIGKSVFFVKGNETTTNVTAASSHLALVGTNDVKVTNVGNGTWAVAIDATGAPNNSQMILTIAVEDALGNKMYKDLQLTFASNGVEQEDGLADTIAAGNFLYVGNGEAQALQLTEMRNIIGWGAVSFSGGVPASFCGLNDWGAWRGRADFAIANPTDEQRGFLTYLAPENAMASFYLNGAKVGGDEPESLPILIDTGYDTSTTNGGVEVTVVMEVANVSPTNLQALLTLNVGKLVNAVGVAVDGDYKLSGIAAGAYPWGTWVRSGSYPSDDKIHRIAFGYAAPESGNGSGGYRGTKVVIDGTNVHSYAGLVYKSQVVKRIALGGGFDKPERTLAGAKILSYEIYPAALSETELKKLTKPASVDYTADVVAEDVVWSNGGGAGLANHGKWVNSSISTITLTNKMSSARIRFDSEVVAAKLSAVQQSGGVLALSADSTPVIGQYDMSGNAGELVLGYPLASALDVSAATVVGGVDATLAFDLGEDVEQSISGTTTVAARLYALKVLSGVLKFTATGGTTSFRGRTVVADGSNAVVRLSAGDATGYKNPGTKIRLANGGTLEVGKRDTLCTPVELDGGIVMLLAGCADGNRGLDLYKAGGNNWTVAGESYLAVATGASANDRKIHLRNGDWNIDVAEGGVFTVDATIVSDAGGDGTRGNIVKTGAGILRLTAANTFATELRVEEGKLELLQPTLGGSLVADEGAIVDLAYDGELSEGAVLLKAGYVEIEGATLLVNGKAAPGVYFSGGKLVVGKPLVTTLLNPHAVTKGGALKVSCNAEAAAGEAAKAYDGDWATYFAPGDVANAKGVSWTGIEFTNGVIVTEIAFSSAMKRRMIGGAFQGANLADYSDATNIYVVESYAGGTVCVALPEAKGPYKYLRFIGMYGGNVSEIKYYGLADSGAVAPTNAPTVLASWSTNGVAGLTLKADAAIPQVYVVQRAMRNFCEDESDYETCVTLAPQLGATTTWTDGEATGYALYRMRGLNPNGASAWTYFEIEPEKLIAGPVAPTFGGNGPGFYASEAVVTIDYPVANAKIYYTLDGSTPTTNSLLYADGITLQDVCGRTNNLANIPTNPSELWSNVSYGWRKPNGDQPNVNVIRARAFLPDGSASTNEIAGTWMIGPTVGEHLTNGLRVVSVITDQENYFGDPKGIMVPGDIYNEKGWVSGQVGQPNANYFQRGADWERPAFIEMFDEKGVEMFSNKMGTRVHGNWSRASAKKTLVCYSRKEHGSKNIKLDKKKFRMFNDEPDHNKYKRIMLRNGGNDWYKACLRDAVGQSMFRGCVNTDTQGYEPMAMYVNGEYWGVYNLRHAYSKQHFEEWNGAVEDDIDYVKLDPDSGDHFEVQEGDFIAMWNIMQYMITCTADGKMDDAEYAVVSNQVDIADMIDFHIVNIFLCNADWIKNGNNMGYWRNRSGSDRKWHFTVYDCDSAMAFDSNSYASSDKLSVALNEVNDTNDGAGKMAPGFLKRCFMNAGFKQRFANRFADLLNTALRVERTTNIVAQAAARIEPEIARTAARWTNMGSVQDWNSNIQSVRTFFVNRPAYAFNQVATHCSGGKPAEIKVTTNGLGRVRINSVESGTHFELPFTGQYFTGIPITLTATAEIGRGFACWKAGDSVVSSNATLVIAPTNGVTLTACFAEPQKDPDLIEGDYPDGLTVAVTNGMVLKVGNATFGGPLKLTGEAAVRLALRDGTTATMPAIEAAGSSLTFDGTGMLALSNSATLVTCAGLVMSNGVLDLAFTGTTEKGKAVLLTGNLLQYGGAISLDLESTAQVFGFYIDTKEMEAKFFGGTFAATVNGGDKSAAIKLNKGSSHATLDGGSWTATMSGIGPRFVNTDGKIKIKSGRMEVKTADGLGTGANVLTCKKELTVSGGVITGEATGAGSEVFSSDAAIEISGGTISVEAADDCFSAAKGMTVGGGKVQALSYAGDAIDSNGGVEIAGGYVFATTRAADGYGIEADGEFIVSGGTVVAVGGPNVIHAPDEGSIACYMNANIASLKKYLVLTSDYLNYTEKLSVNLESGEKRNADGFSLVAVVPNMYGSYSDTDTKPSKDKPKGEKLDEDIDGVFVTTIEKAQPSIVPGIDAPTFDTEEAATNMAAQAAVSRPAEVASSNVVSEADYAAMFDVKAVQTAMHTWELVPELKESVSNEVQTAVDAATSNVTLMATMTTETPTAKVTTQAGLFYGMAATNAVDSVGEAVIPFERWVLGTGAEQELTADRPGESAGFYQIRVQIEPPRK